MGKWHHLIKKASKGIAQAGSAAFEHKLNVPNGIAKFHLRARGESEDNDGSGGG